MNIWKWLLEENKLCECKHAQMIRYKLLNNDFLVISDYCVTCGITINIQKYEWDLEKIMSDFIGTF